MIKNKNKIFIGLVSALALACGAGGARAAIDRTGCDDDNNVYVTPELALCTTHAYNIGLSENPSDAVQKELVKDVVALKTTVITKQMYDQYRFLDKAIKQLKTQLEKEVLLTKLEAAGALPSGSSSGGGQSQNSDGLSMAKDCTNSVSDYAGAYSCLQNNIAVIRNAIENDNRGAALRQLKKDVDAAGLWSISTQPTTGVDPCENLSSKKESLNKCLNTLSVEIAKAIDDRKNKSSGGYIIVPQNKE